MNDMAPTTIRRLDPAMGNLGYERNPSDFYPTPAWCTEALLRNYPFPRLPISEPACGQGHISKVLEANGFQVISTDLNHTGFGSGGHDFLSAKTSPAPIIITNPPYKNQFAERFLRHALRLTEHQYGIVAMFMRTDWSSAAGRTELMRHPAFALKLEMTRRPRWIEGSTGSPRHNYSFYVWDWGTVGEPPTIKFDQ